MIVRQIPGWVAVTNSWVVAEERGGPALVIDVPPEPVEVGDYLVAQDLSLAAILLTHGHVDHTGGAGALARRTGAVAYVHPDDDFLTLHPAEQMRRLFGLVPPGDFAPPDEIVGLVDGKVLDLAGLDWEVRHTPGHTPGHCCFHLAEEGILFSGDQLFAGSVGRTDLPGGDYPTLMASMRERVMTLDDNTRVLPGHGPETTIGRERRHNPFLADL